ncbi:UNVERIFIED_CONTAM: putative WRKY transcription factor 2 [Sesamum radiatum]|uniref:WRKY transcription factor 2 n=1 Tax=Sesamum radiatum TaxID=300843 RepID=A0AAW2K3R8_SESRA
MIADDVVARAIADSSVENKGQPPFLGPEGHSASGSADRNDLRQASTVGDEASNSNSLAGPKVSSRGGLMERIAARAGFNAPRLNTESIKPADLSKNQEVRSPYLTIPPGLSPATLLESPVFLSNSLVLPSPTTGKFSFALSGNNQHSMLTSDDPDKGKENTSGDTSSFAFKPIPESGTIPCFNAANKSFPGVGVSARSNTSFLHRSVEPPEIQTFSKPHAEKNSGSNLSSEQTYHSVGFAENSPPLDEPHEDDGDQRSSGDNIGGGQAEDGYNWRKYGQKQVKGSEYPRSYYKCTHPNCPVKKKVERSHEGAPDWRQDNLEATSSAQLVQEYSNGATFQAQNGAQYESGDAVDGSSPFSNDEEDDDQATHASVSLGYDVEGDESESKRRRIETYASEMSGATRAIREPRVVVQTTSEVDILDDGYRWRKYGQKVVKGNPNPRSYYKCTSAGCNVRKHVERASHDLKSVITTYEGKHNHDVPAARNSSHVNSGGPNTLPAQQAHGAAVSSQVHRPEPSQIHGSAARFERPGLGSFGLPGRPQLGLGPGFGFGMNQAGLASLGLAGLGRNQSNLPVLPVHPYIGHQPRPMNDMGLMQPKAEPKLEPHTDSGLNSSDGSSVYQQLIGRLPLGPQM